MFGGECFALRDREVDLDLLEPIRVDRAVNWPTQPSMPGRFVAIYHSGNVALVLSGFVKDGNLVTFVLGEMCVITLADFDLAAWGVGYPHFPPTQVVNQSCTSNLNSRSSIERLAKEY